MNLYLQEWANGTASLVNEFGQVLSAFADIEEAKSICRIWQVEIVGILTCKVDNKEKGHTPPHDTVSDSDYLSK